MRYGFVIDPPFELNRGECPGEARAEKVNREKA